MQTIAQGVRGLRLVWTLNGDWMLTVSIIAGALAFGAWVAGS
ncbi:hypothetical protein ROJ8625_01420 [Roseivivax jejudonensis]|uniref:Uncharacterized protein n=1 Tax=Roseivivax jejudonensis TaxID=1529041 RepID=A0A1X6YUM5_9RHOB|nr:hypothetical protein [Roseivivax jejudonensis]SLN31417.1 hypothetical protein ROJ8625_01420 [Roseivivax jejudonensis]